MERFGRQIQDFSSASNKIRLVLCAERKGASPSGFLLHRQNYETDVAEMLRLVAKTEEEARAESQKLLKDPKVRYDKWERTNCLKIAVSTECLPGPWTKINIPPYVSPKERRAGHNIEARDLYRLNAVS